MKAENYIIKGTFFRPKLEKQEINSAINDLQQTIKVYFGSQNYFYIGPDVYGLRFFEQKFVYKSSGTKISKIKKYFGKNELEQAQENHFEDLKRARQDIPGTIDIHVYYGKENNSEGFYIEATVKPIKYLKIVQLRDSVEIDEKEYSFIVQESIQFLEGFARANLCTTVKSPKPLSTLIKSETSVKLKKFGFEEIGLLLEDSKRKIELGDNLGGIDSLIGVIEKFLKEFVRKNGESPKDLHQPEKNIEILKDKKIIGDKMGGVILGVLFNHVYQKLKEDSHLRKTTYDLFDLRLFTDLTEKSIDYILEKSWKYKIK